MNAVEIFSYLKRSLHYDPIINAAVLNVHRTLEKVYPNDEIYGDYRAQYATYGEDFFDFFHLLWHIGAVINPKNIMEIGCRTGTSLVQLLSAMPNLAGKKVVVFDSFKHEILSPTDRRFCSDKVVRANLEYLNLPTDMIQFVIGQSQETLPIWRRQNPNIKFDYILVDGGHAYEDEKIDMEHSAEMIAPGGVLLMDDLVAPHLHKLWNEFKASKGNEFLYAESFAWKGVGMAVRVSVSK